MAIRSGKTAKAVPAFDTFAAHVCENEDQFTEYSEQIVKVFGGEVAKGEGKDDDSGTDRGRHRPDRLVDVLRPRPLFGPSSGGLLGYDPPGGIPLDEVRRGGGSEELAQTAQICALLANIHRGKNRRPFRPGDFYPYELPKGPEVDLTREDIDSLRDELKTPSTDGNQTE